MSTRFMIESNRLVPTFERPIPEAVGDVELASEIVRNALRYSKGTKRISHVGVGKVAGYTMITCVLKGAKTRDELKNGYVQTYTYNMECPEMSEFGDIFVQNRPYGDTLCPYRVCGDAHWITA